MKLYPHQINAIERGVKRPLCIFHDMGLGKALTALMIFKRLGYVRMLVICPLSLIKGTWEVEIAKWTSYEFCNLRGQKTQADIYLANYEMLYRKFDYIQDIVSPATMLVLDESSRVKSNRSIIYKKVKKLSESAGAVYCLSGTPAPNNEMELWTQVDLVEPEILGKNFYAFRNHFFVLQRGKTIMESVPRDKQVQASLFARGWKWSMTKRKKEKLMRIIAPIVDWVKKEDAVELPETIDEIRDVYLTPKAVKIYKDLEKKLVAEVNGETIAVQVALAKLLKLREITSGFIFDATGKTLPISDEKLKVLDETLSDIGNYQVIIWAIFRRDIEVIYEKYKAKSVYVYGGMTDLARSNNIEAFRGGRVQYLIANPASIAHGLTFTNCQYSVYYSLDYSYEHYAQSKARIHRIGQKNACTYIHLLAKGTIDEDIYECLKGKKSKEELLANLLRR